MDMPFVDTCMSQFHEGERVARFMCPLGTSVDFLSFLWALGGGMHFSEWACPADACVHMDMSVGETRPPFFPRTHPTPTAFPSGKPCPMVRTQFELARGCAASARDTSVSIKSVRIASASFFAMSCQGGCWSWMRVLHIHLHASAVLLDIACRY